MSVQANCPSCGGPCTFKVSTSLVTVCPYCQSVIARGDRGLESLGKVADLVETASPLDVGVKGRFDGVSFELTGRTQFQHPAGGVWDEWYAAFADGRWGWLAEAQGRFYLTFEKPVPQGMPGYDRLTLGQKIDVGDGRQLIVAEKNRGKTAGARGEIPYRVVPGKEIPFADLSGPKGEFGTIDFGDESPALYVGRQVTLDELGIPPKERRKFPGQEPGIQAISLNCPHCGGALSLRAPDRSERVGCPNCGSLLDIREGKLKLLRSLEPPKVQPILALGATGQREGVEWTVIGFMQRYVTLDGVDYFWEEYLLYQPRLGFRWLTRSDEHWNWVEALPPGCVSVEGNLATYAGRWYRLFQKATANVAFVVGEFYWRVEAGEKVGSEDYVQAPEMLSLETTEGDEGEINWSHGVYLRHDEVEKMFRLADPLPAPVTIGPNQPFPHTGVYRAALWLCVAAVLLACLAFVFSPRRTVLQSDIALDPPKGQRSQMVSIDPPLELRDHQNIRVTVTPKAGSPWIHVNGSLDSVSPSPTPGASRSLPAAEHHPFAFAAVNNRPAWVYLSSVPAGKYTMHFDATWKDPGKAEMELRVEQGVPHPFKLLMTITLLGAVPLAIAVYQLIFESRRWRDSNVT
jgi:hypothetical protein